MIHLKPLTHHGLQTHKPHKQGYLKWHYHPNTQEQHRIKELQEQIANTSNPYSKAYLQEQLSKRLLKHSSYQPQKRQNSKMIIRNLELILKTNVDRHALNIIRGEAPTQPAIIPQLIQTLTELKQQDKP